MGIILGLAFGILWARLAASAANKRGRSSVLWAISSFICGLIPLIILCVVPKLYDPESEEIPETYPTDKLGRWVLAFSIILGVASISILFT